MRSESYPQSNTLVKQTYFDLGKKHLSRASTLAFVFTAGDSQ